MRFTFWILVLTIWTGCSTPRVLKDGDRVNHPETLSKPTVLLISIDGYRNDYTDRFQPPNLTKIRDEGVSAQYLLPVFPSKTFTNHLSIITGLYAEGHGIVANSFFDPEKNKTFKLEPQITADGSWYGGVPLWVLAEKQGMLAATYFWPGSSAKIQEMRPSYYLTYDDKIPHSDRIKQVRQWLSLPEDRRPHFITLYFSDVDAAGHKYGPNSKEVEDAVAKVDRTIGNILEMAKDPTVAGAHDLNIVLVSDHGMQEIRKEEIQYLEDKVDLKGANVMGGGSQVQIYFEDKSRLEPVYQALKKQKEYTVLKRTEFPKRWHYALTPRVGDLLVMAQPPYTVVGKRPLKKFERGVHGFDPDHTPDMRGIFYAIGPEFKRKMVVPAFRNIHIYPLIQKILGLKKDGKIDGDLKVLQGVIRGK